MEKLIVSITANKNHSFQPTGHDHRFILFYPPEGTHKTTPETLEVKSTS